MNESGSDLQPHRKDQDKRFDPPTGSSDEVRKLVEDFGRDFAQLSIPEITARMIKISATLRLDVPSDTAANSLIGMATWVSERLHEQKDRPWGRNDDASLRDSLFHAGVIPHPNSTRQESGPKPRNLPRLPGSPPSLKGPK